MSSNPGRLFLFAILFLSALCRVNAQQDLPFADTGVTISMDFKDADLKDILKVLSIQSGLNFIASEAVQDRKMTLYLDKVTIRKAMDKIFRANNLTYELGKNDNIFIVKDWGKPQLDLTTKVYYIKYRGIPSANLDKEKTSLLAKCAAGAGSEGGAPDMVESIKQLLSPDGKISEDIKTNSLIITDVPSRFKNIEKVIALLDVPQSQIMLDVEILDVSKNTVDKLGFKWGDLDTDGGSPFTLLVPGGTGRGPKFFMGNIINANSTKKWPNVTQGSVTLGSTYSQILDFLRRQTDTRYLARPKLLTLNNETAEISVTRDDIVGFNEELTVPANGLPIVKRTYIRSTELKLTPEGVGIFLRVTPQINPETKEIIMVINPKSSVTTVSVIASTQSDEEVRTTKSIVKIKDGETVILGGLIHKDKYVINDKLPILGDIPFIGALFRHKDQQKDSERELLIFITPRIVKESKLKKTNSKNRLPPALENEPMLDISRQEIINEFLNELDRKRK